MVGCRFVHGKVHCLLGRRFSAHRTVRGRVWILEEAGPKQGPRLLETHTLGARARLGPAHCPRLDEEPNM